MDAAELLTNIRLGAPEPDSALVELLSRWAGRGRAKAAAAGPRDVTTGRMPLRNAWTKRTRMGETPFARAVRT